MKGLRNENCKTLLKEIEDTEKRKDILCSCPIEPSPSPLQLTPVRHMHIHLLKVFCAHGLEDFTLLKCSYYLKQSTDSMKFLSKFQWYFSQREQTILKFICNHQRPPIINAIVRNKNAGSIMLPGFKLYYKAILIKTVWSWHKYRHIDQWNRYSITTQKPRIYIGKMTQSLQ